MNNTYDKRMSIFKALGIIFVVMAHCTFYTPFYKFVHGYNVVFFFFISGYFFKDKYLNTPVLFVKNKIKRLYFPWVKYGIAFVLLHNLFLNLHLLHYNIHTHKYIEPYSFSDILSKSFQVLLFFRWKEVLLAPLWFLFGLFSGIIVLYIISFVLNRMFPQKLELLRFIAIVLVFIFGFAGAFYFPRYNVFNRPLIIAGLIYIGKLYGLFEREIPNSFFIAVFLFVFYTISTYLSTDINVGAMRFDNPVVFLVTSLAGFYWLLYFAEYLNNKDLLIVKYLNLIGDNTLTIMALHYIAFKLVNLLQIAIYNYPIKYLAYYPVIPIKTEYWWILYTIVGILVPLLLAIFYDKTKYILVSNSKNLFRTIKGKRKEIQ